MNHPLHPRHALSSVMQLLGHFNNVLSQGISGYQKTHDDLKFRKTLKHLCGDIAYFTENFEAWNHIIKTAGEHKKLKVLQTYLKQAKDLVIEAAYLVDEARH